MKGTIVNLTGNEKKLRPEIATETDIIETDIETKVLSPVKYVTSSH